MARYALVNEAGETASIILWDGVSPYAPPAGFTLVPESDAPPLAEPAPEVPFSVSARQARLALLAAGLLESFEASIAEEGGVVAIEWEYATQIERASPLVAFFTAKKGLTGAQVDALFVDAATR